MCFTACPLDTFTVGLKGEGRRGGSLSVIFVCSKKSCLYLLFGECNCLRSAGRVKHVENGTFDMSRWKDDSEAMSCPDHGQWNRSEEYVKVRGDR